MKKCTMKAIAVISAAAMVSAGMSVSAGAVCSGSGTVQVSYGGSQCFSLNNSSIRNILKKYGYYISNNCGYNSNCTGSGCGQTGAAKPSCVNKAPAAAASDCTGGSCGQITVTRPSCVNKTPAADTGCTGGNCTVTKPDTGAETDEYEVSEYEQEVVRLINEIRAENGLSELKLNTELSKVARVKAQDMSDNLYFSHTSPTYGSPFEMMNSFGIIYRTAGENIAYGQRTPEKVVSAWMNSKGHRDNILNASFKEIGMGYVSDGRYWVQMFIG